MKTQLFLTLLLLPVALGFFKYGLEYESVDEEDLYPFAGKFAERLPVYLDALVEGDLGVPHWTEQDRAKLVVGRQELRRSSTRNEGCNNCRMTLLALFSLIKAGNDYEDLKNITMDLCYDVVPPWDPDQLCEGALDNYGPHLVYILNITDKTPQEICFQYNNCYPEDEGNVTVARGQQSNESRDLAPLPARRKTAPSVRKQGRTNKELEGMLKVLHITDIHIDEFYKQGEATDCNMPICCRTMWMGEGSAERWGDFSCNIPHETMHHFFEYLSALQPDLIMYTGDTPPHTVWLETQAGQLNVSEQLAQKINEYFPGVPAFTTLGNHESYPTNLYYLPRPEIQELNVEMAQYWKDLSGFGDEQIRTFHEAGYYSILVREGLRVMSWNSNYGAGDNFYNILNDDTAEEYLSMRAYFEAELASARANGERVIMLGHHPTGSDSSINYNARYVTQLFAEYGDVIVFYLLGHNHGDEYRMIRDLETGEPKVVAISGATMTSKSKNPSAKMFYVDPVTYTAVDADAYAVDIALHANSETLEVQPTYRYSTEYGLPDLSAQSFYDLAERFLTEPEVLSTYLYNADTRRSEPEPCAESCLQREVCKIMNNVNDLYRACRDLPFPEILR